jgi:hypothetical protein
VLDLHRMCFEPFTAHHYNTQLIVLLVVLLLFNALLDY